MSNVTVYECHCPFCGKTTTVTVKIGDLYKYEVLRETVQNAFPSLSATEREQIITGMCPDCQNDVFGDDEED